MWVCLYFSMFFNSSGVWFIVTVVIFVACTFVTCFNEDQSINQSIKYISILHRFQDINLFTADPVKALHFAILVWPTIFNFWHLGALALRTERQSARMSNIKNGGLDQYGAEPFEQQQFGTAGAEGLNTYLPKKLRRHVTLTTPTWGQFVITETEPVEKPPYPAVGKQGASHLYLGGLQFSSAGTDNIELICNKMSNIETSKCTYNLQVTLSRQQCTDWLIGYVFLLVVCIQYS